MVAIVDGVETMANAGGAPPISGAVLMLLDSRFAALPLARCHLLGRARFDPQNGDGWTGIDITFRNALSLTVLDERAY